MKKFFVIASVLALLLYSCEQANAKKFTNLHKKSIHAKIKSAKGEIMTKKTASCELEKHLIPNRVDIDLRPIEADMRLEFGHFEADTIVSLVKVLNLPF